MGLPPSDIDLSTGKTTRPSEQYWVYVGGLRQGERRWRKEGMVGEEGKSFELCVERRVNGGENYCGDGYLKRSALKV